MISRQLNLIKNPDFYSDPSFDVYKDIEITLVDKTGKQKPVMMEASSIILGTSSYFHLIFILQTATNGIIECDFAPIAVCRSVIQVLHGCEWEPYPKGATGPIWLFQLECIQCANFLGMDTKIFSKNLAVPEEGISELLQIVMLLRTTDDNAAMANLRRILPNKFLENVHRKYPFLEKAFIKEIFPETSNSCTKIPCGYWYQSTYDLKTDDDVLRMYNLVQHVAYYNRLIYVETPRDYRQHRIINVINAYNGNVIFSRNIRDNSYYLTPDTIVYMCDRTIFAYDVIRMEIINSYYDKIATSIKYWSDDKCVIQHSDRDSLIWNFRKNFIVGGEKLFCKRGDIFIVYSCKDKTLKYTYKDKTYISGPDPSFVNMEEFIYCKDYECIVIITQQEILILCLRENGVIRGSVDCEVVQDNKFRGYKFNSETGLLKVFYLSPSGAIDVDRYDLMELLQGDSD